MLELLFLRYGQKANPDKCGDTDPDNQKPLLASGLVTDRDHIAHGRNLGRGDESDVKLASDSQSIQFMLRTFHNLSFCKSDLKHAG